MSENKILEVIEKRVEIMRSQNSYCPGCGERQFSVFDKLWLAAYGACYTKCNKDNEIEQVRMADNIFAIIEMD